MYKFTGDILSGAQGTIGNKTQWFRGDRPCSHFNTPWALARGSLDFALYIGLTTKSKAVGRVCFKLHPATKEVAHTITFNQLHRQMGIQASRRQSRPTESQSYKRSRHWHEKRWTHAQSRECRASHCISGSLGPARSLTGVLFFQPSSHKVTFGSHLLGTQKRPYETVPS